jgi:phage terminase small subunit
MTPQQQRFVEEYLIDLNATKAAIRAGYSAKTAEQQGYQLLQNTSVSAAIAEAMEKRSQETAIDAAWVLTEARKVYEAAMGKDSLPAALKALEIMGKHVNVQAFKEQIDHRHSMTGEEALRILDHYRDRHAQRSEA